MCIKSEDSKKNKGRKKGMKKIKSKKSKAIIIESKFG